MSLLTGIFDFVKNLTLNSAGVDRDLHELIKDRDIGRAKQLFQDRDLEVAEAIKEFNPMTHDVMARPNKYRKGKEPYIVQKLPRNWQKYINEIALFFLLAKPIRWNCNNLDESNSDAFDAFCDFIRDTRFDARMRQAKRLAGAETESAKIYHIYRDENNNPEVKVLVIAKSEGYSLRPLFDQYKNLKAFGCGYFLQEGATTVEHFDIYTSEVIYRCKKNSLGWDVAPVQNASGKINVIYYKQDKEWAGAEPRIARDEMLDSKTADTNEYFADPMAKATADVIDALSDPESVGKLIQLQGKDSEFGYVEPPQSNELKESEKKVLKESILYDTLTPDFSYENMKGTGSLSGEALRRAMILGYVKRDNRKEIYDEMVDREKNLILSIMMNVTHIEMREQLSKLEIEHEFSEPFDQDTNERWVAIGSAYASRIISLETAVQLMDLADTNEEIQRILKEKEDDAKRERMVGVSLGGE